MQIIEIITNESGQTIHLPADCRIEAKTMAIIRVGRSLVLMPDEASLWQAFNDGIGEFSDDYMRERNQPETSDSRPDFE